MGDAMDILELVTAKVAELMEESTQALENLSIEPLDAAELIDELEIEFGQIPDEKSEALLSDDEVPVIKIIGLFVEILKSQGQ